MIGRRDVPWSSSLLHSVVKCRTGAKIRECPSSAQLVNLSRKVFECRNDDLANTRLLSKVMESEESGGTQFKVALVAMTSDLRTNRRSQEERLLILHFGAL